MIQFPKNVRPYFNTQNNECFNELKTKFKSKNRKYENSPEMRMSETVLEWNEEDWDDDRNKSISFAAAL